MYLGIVSKIVRLDSRTTDPTCLEFERSPLFAFGKETFKMFQKARPLHNKTWPSNNNKNVG